MYVIIPERGVFNFKKASIVRRYSSSLIILSAFTLLAAPPSGYYDSFEGKSGEALKAAVKSKVRKHTTVNYGDNTWEAFRKTDVREVDGKLCWWDMYSSNNVPVSSGHPGMNIEHSVANSCWGGSKNDAYKDMCHLNPSDATANNRKSNYPLGIVAGTPTWTNGVTIVGKPASGYGGGAGHVYEPHDMYKGDFARAYFYMFTVYDDINWGSYPDKRDAMYDCSGATVQLKPWAVQMLLQWNTADPVGQKEADRNDGIYSVQRNRNPFIDIPDLAEYIWGDKKSTPFHYDPSAYPENPDNPDNPDNPPLPGIPGTWELVRSSDGLTSSDLYIITSASSMMGMSADISGKFISPAATVTAVDDVVSSVPDGTAIVTLSATGSSFAIGLAPTEETDPLYICSTSAKTVTLETSPSAEGAAASVSISSDGVATVSYGAAGNLCYNASSPRFTTYTSTGQEYLRFYRRVKESSVDGVAADLRLQVWAEAGILHVPASAAVFDLAGRRIVAPSSVAQAVSLPGGIYVVTSPGARPLKIAL